MKKGLLYYCLAVSLIVHLLIVLGVRLENFEKKEKEPIVIDVAGPLKWGPRTVLPAGKEPPETKTAALKPPERPVTERPRRQFRPSFPSIPLPAAPAPAQKAPPPAAGLPPAPGNMVTPAPQGQGGAGTQAEPAPPPVKTQPAQASGPRRLVLPSKQDLERYAKADIDPKDERRNETVTLDTEDLMFTSYLQGLKRRIELIWKYPETARRDGLQGSLVLRFSIGKSGRLENVELLKSSGYPMLDEAAKQALMDANPFNPLPDNWRKDSFTITGTFVYRISGLYLR